MGTQQIHENISLILNRVEEAYKIVAVIGEENKTKQRASFCHSLKSLSLSIVLVLSYHKSCSRTGKEPEKVSRGTKHLSNELSLMMLGTLHKDWVCPSMPGLSQAQLRLQLGLTPAYLF